MKQHCKFFSLVIALLLVATSAFAQEQVDSAVVDYSLWLGAHYNNYDGNDQRVGMYMLGEDGWFPEFKFNLNARKKDSSVLFKSHFYDEKNIFANLNLVQSDRIDFMLDYVSLIRRTGQDELANLEAREWLGTRPGGKMMTHELTDLGVDYGRDRQTISSRLSVLLSKKGNVTLNVAHRSILEKGNDQKMAMSHCFSCHVESQEWQLDQETHSIRAGLGAEVRKIGLEYVFQARRFDSSVGDPMAYYDPAKHPVNGGAGAEFSSRVIYQDEFLEFGMTPETEKYSHVGKVRGKVWKGRLNGSLGYTQTENKQANLEVNAWNGNLAYAVPVAKKHRLVAKLYGMHRMSDNVGVNLPVWRESRPDSNPVNFSWYRYSSLSRIEGRGSLEWIYRLTGHTTLSLLGGYKHTDRVDYPTPQTTYSTKKATIQGRVRYRDGAKLKGMAMYRYENTQDPLRSDRGLLEENGRYILQKTSPAWAFYYQREDLRFLNVTSLPTDNHELHLTGGMRATDCLDVNLGLKTVYDKNSDLDTLDVHHYMIQPNLNLVMRPCEGVTLNTGYTYDYSKSRGPIAIPLFDG